MSVLIDIHRLIAVLVAIAAGLLVLIVILGAATRRPLPFARDRTILVAMAMVGVGAVVGAALLVGGHAPSDPLHLLYAVVALLVLPVARFWTPLARRRALAMTVAGVALALLVLRLFQTG